MGRNKTSQSPKSHHPSEECYCMLLAFGARLDDSMIEEIAQADHGYDVEEHQPALEKIKLEGYAPYPMGWVPRECLELLRWSDPSDELAEYGSKGERGHSIRAFCCAALLASLCQEKEDEPDITINDSLARLIASAKALGGNYSSIVSEFVNWYITVMPHKFDEGPYLYLAQLYLYCATSRSLDNEKIFKLVCSVEVEVERARYADWSIADLDDWFFGISVFDQSRNYWERYARELLELATSKSGSRAHDRLLSLCTKILN